MSGNVGIGLGCCVVAGVFFGTNYLPVKKLNIGDGVFFAACMALGILLVGTLVNFTIADGDSRLTPHGGPPAFVPQAAVAGALWMIGNFLCPFVIEKIGLGLGLGVARLAQGALWPGLSHPSAMSGDIGVGLGCCVVAGVFFGSNYLPVKKLHIGDGVFFAACMVLGILLVGTLVNFTIADEDYGLTPHRGPRFEPKAAVAGALWMIGNFLCPFVIEKMGLGLGLAVWDCSNLFTGWATGKFGLFGVDREAVACPAMNYAGLVLACLSLVLLAQAGEEGDAEAEAGSKGSAKTEAGEQGDAEAEADDNSNSQDKLRSKLHRTSTLSTTCTTSHDEEAPADVDLQGAGENMHGLGMKYNYTASTLCPSLHAPLPDLGDSIIEDLESMSTERLPSELTEAMELPSEQPMPEQLSMKQPLRLGSLGLLWRSTMACLAGGFTQGFCLALLAGVFFGLTFVWPTDLMQLGKLGYAHSTNPMDYVFSHFVGIAVTALVVLVGYVATKRGESYTPRNVVLPAIASGAMWAVAQVAWFKANVELSLVVAFPIISTLPGIISILWGFLFFGEFRSQRSRRMVLSGMCLRLPAVVLIGLSNVL
eukprot:CAMPEP_0195153534 /NCGR_PEP_ID=MMETSP0448-20130528/183197_1 /TAXON_ID=66468 /ORGANISM="Heterocapsa triquestra, Strain CCMP 448" /LENGTH=592 /DNA_ID=CAMNT_0040192301 /DNA_START=66 /DNA_END=1843 /DNA_ORIENTATION=-